MVKLVTAFLVTLSLVCLMVNGPALIEEQDEQQVVLLESIDESDKLVPYVPSKTIDSNDLPELQSNYTYGWIAQSHLPNHERLHICSGTSPPHSPV